MAESPANIEPATAVAAPPDMKAAKAMVVRIMKAFPRQADRSNIARGYAERAGLDWDEVYRLMVEIECGCLAARPWA